MLSWSVLNLIASLSEVKYRNTSRDITLEDKIKTWCYARDYNSVDQ